jgi:hypothetical protein
MDWLGPIHPSREKKYSRIGPRASKTGLEGKGIGTTVCAVPCRVLFVEALGSRMICTFPYSKLLGTGMRNHLVPPTNLPTYHLSIHHTEYSTCTYIEYIQKFSPTSHPNPVTLIKQPRLALTAENLHPCPIPSLHMPQHISESSALWNPTSLDHIPSIQ